MRKSGKRIVPGGNPYALLVIFWLIFGNSPQKDALAESLGAGHVFSCAFLQFSGPRNLDPLEPARANPVFPFPEPIVKR